MNTLDILDKATQAKTQLALLKTEEKNKALLMMADSLIEDKELSNFDIKNEHTFFPTSYFRR